MQFTGLSHILGIWMILFSTALLPPLFVSIIYNDGALPILLIFIGFIGGCGGSTAGGIKVMRVYDSLCDDVYIVHVTDGRDGHGLGNRVQCCSDLY